MEHRGPKPRVNAYVRPSEVVPSHGMILGDPLGQRSRSLNVRNQVQDGKRDRGGLLHPSIPNKWPLPIILYDGLPILDSFIGEEPHALVLAFVGAGPLGEAEEEGNLALAFEVVQTDWDAILE
jgi:hypothetical protein